VEKLGPRRTHVNEILYLSISPKPVAIIQVSLKSN